MSSNRAATLTAVAIAAILKSAEESIGKARLFNDMKLSDTHEGMDIQDLEVIPILTLELLAQSVSPEQEEIVLATIPIGDMPIGLASVGLETGVAAHDAGTADSFRVKNCDGATVYRGQVTDSSSDGGLLIDNPTFAVGETIMIAPFRNAIV